MLAQRESVPALNVEMSVSNESTAAPGVVIALARWLYGFHCISSLTSEVAGTIQIEKEPEGSGSRRMETRSSVGNTGDGTLSILALGSRKLISTYPAGEGPDGMAVLPTELMGPP